MIKEADWDTWMAQSGKRLTPDVISGHDCTVLETELCIGLCADSTGPAWDSLSPSLSLLLPPRALSLPQNKFKKTLKKGSILHQQKRNA